MIDAYREFWLNYANFGGTATRSDYWLFVLMQMIVTFVMGLIAGSSGGSMIGRLVFMIVMLIYWLACMVPMLSLTVRRLRDAGIHWAFIFIQFIPVIGGIAMLIFICMPSKPYAY